MPDSEIEAMSAVASALTDLSPEERHCVLRWACDRYEVGIENRLQRSVRRDADPESGEVNDEKVAAEAPRFEHLAELFAAAQPDSDADKALVAGYFLQTIKSQEKWKAADAQKELKDMGTLVKHRQVADRQYQQATAAGHPTSKGGQFTASQKDVQGHPRGRCIRPRHARTWWLMWP